MQQNSTGTGVSARGLQSTSARKITCRLDRWCYRKVCHHVLFLCILSLHPLSFRTLKKIFFSFNKEILYLERLNIIGGLDDPFICALVYSQSCFLSTVWVLMCVCGRGESPQTEFLVGPLHFHKMMHRNQHNQVSAFQFLDISLILNAFLPAVVYWTPPAWTTYP